MNRIQLRRSVTPGLVPSLSDLLVGEIGLNLVDKAVYFNNGSEIVKINAAVNIEQDATHRFVTDAQIGAWSTPYELPVASASVVGGVKIGSNIDVDVDGVISLKIASATDAGVLSAADWAMFNAKQDALGFTPVDRAGDTMEGPLVLPGVPTLANQAATKAYVDGEAATKLNLAGGTMSGPLVLNADPSDGLGAATKQYVDMTVSGVSGQLGAPVQTVLELSALASGARIDKMLRLVEDNGSVYRFDEQSVLPAEDDGVIIPDDLPATGRWIKIQSMSQNHEALSGLQGGAAGDHLHLTTVEKNGYDAHLADYALHLTSEQNTFLDSITATAVEVNRLSGVTSNVQDQLDGKQASLGFTPVDVAGDTMTGPLVLAADPTAALEAVTKQYVDNLVIDAGVF